MKVIIRVGWEFCWERYNQTWRNWNRDSEIIAWFLLYHLRSKFWANISVKWNGAHTTQKPTPKEKLLDQSCLNWLTVRYDVKKKMDHWTILFYMRPVNNNRNLVRIINLFDKIDGPSFKTWYSPLCLHISASHFCWLKAKILPGPSQDHPLQEGQHCHS